MAFDLLFNGALGGNIRATMQQKLKVGLGLMWSDNQGTFIPGSSLFTDISYPVVQQNPSENSVNYFGQAVFNSVFTGDLVVGYHDLDNGDTNLFSEVRHVRRGLEVSFVISPDRLQTKIAESFIAYLSRRGDNKIVSLNDITVADAEIKPFAFELSQLVPDGVHVSDVTAVTVTPTGEMVVVALGGHDAQAILDIEGGQIQGKSYTVSCNVLTSDGDQIEANVKVNCKTPFA